MISAEFALFVDRGDNALQYYVICKWSRTQNTAKYSHKALNLKHNIYGPSVVKYCYHNSFEWSYRKQNKIHRYYGPARIFTDPYQRKAEYILMNKRSCLFGPAIVHVADNLTLEWHINGKKVAKPFAEITPTIMRGVCETIDMLAYIQPRLTQLKYVHCMTTAQLHG
jgi:hypothetical protein